MHQRGDASLYIDGTPIAAAVFDLDGVVTRTARLHAAAWKRLFDELLARHARADGTPQPPFDLELDYRRHVDGKPRLQGIRDFLAARGIRLPEGQPDDPPGLDTVHGLGRYKDELFRQALAREGVAVIEPSVAFIRRLRALGVRTALVSASRNAKAVLAAAGLAELFDVVVDGNDAARLGLAGKPAPDTFRHAAAALGVPPSRTLAAEDAEAGVAAARAAGYGHVVALAGPERAAALLAQGADRVVRDLGELEMASAALPDALACFDRITVLLATRRPALFLDYDGTLTPIVDRPEQAQLSTAMRATIRALAERCPVAVVSGRDRADVARLVGIDGLIYAGSHGFDIAGPKLDLQYQPAAAFLPDLDRAEARLRQALADVPGALVERKRYALAAHYRLVAPERVTEVEAAVAAALAASDGRLRRTGGKKVFELRPCLPWDKGRAVRWLLETLGLDRPEVLPLYIGDDETDEDAFAALRPLGGLGVLVAAQPQPSAADYRLADPAAVERFLRALIGILPP